jgi:hypothetical protein
MSVQGQKKYESKSSKPAKSGERRNHHHQTSHSLLRRAGQLAASNFATFAYARSSHHIPQLQKVEINRPLPAFYNK